MAIQTKTQRIAELEAVLRLVHKDLLQRGTKEEDGGIVVDVGAGVWSRICDAISQGITARGQYTLAPKLPEHHKKWYEQLLEAAANNATALVSCLDAETLEQRSVIALVNVGEEEFSFVPIGHLCPSNNPYLAYLPPSPELETVQ